MKVFAREHPVVIDRDISTAAFWAQTLVERDRTFAWLRRNAAVSWHLPIEAVLSAPDHGEAGFWAVTRASDINYVSQNHDLFSSWIGGFVARPGNPRLAHSPTFMNMDPPEHNSRRAIISPAFTPKGVARIRSKIEERAEQIVGAVLGVGEFDFVERVSSQLPMLTIADLFGVPESQIASFTKAGNDIMDSTDPDALPEGVSAVEFRLKAMEVLRDISQDLVRYRRRHPADDIATALAEADVGGHPLSDDEIASMTVLLATAGNDTTRHTTSWTALNLSRNPDQKEWLAQDYEGRIGQAVEEFIRHATVVNMFARTATQDTELGGQAISEGDKVVMFYCSGNRDESLFPDPHRFDVGRPRTSHVAFGGRGVHFCLGNIVAKAQLKAIFGQVLTKIPNFQILGDPVRARSEFVNGIRYLPALSS